VRVREGAFVEASADDDAGDANGLELADVVGLPDAARGDDRRFDGLGQGPLLITGARDSDASI